MNTPIPRKTAGRTWLNSVFACRGEVALVRIHMEDAGANSPLVFDLGSMDAALDRMELLAGTLEEDAIKTPAAVRRLLNTLVQGQLEDSRVSSLIRQNFNLLARKTVERTGHGGEHYIARNRKEYWHMWAAAIGGGFLTVFTAAIKLHIVGIHRAPVMEFLLVGTNYAISFLLLQTFGLALATKQPAATGASLANIINRNRGDSRRSQVTDFAASISRTQLAAAIGNVLAVSLGAVVFNLLWLRIFHHSYVPDEQAQKIYRSLRPLASPTAIDAALTGVLLWLAGLIGGWFENFAVYHRIPASIAQHKLRQTIGDRRMQTIADWVDRNIGPWSTSISLGYLLAFLPVVAEFFGLPLDVRHVTLNTGMFAFAAARVGPSAFVQVWLYSAMVGIAVMFVLNLGVSFAIASYVALRAYDVSHQERVSLLRYVLKQLISAPLQFFYPVRAEAGGGDCLQRRCGRSLSAFSFRTAWERFDQQVCGGPGKAFVVDVRVQFNQPDLGAELRFQRQTIGVERFPGKERASVPVDSGNPSQWNQHRHRPARAIEPPRRDTPDLRTFVRSRPHEGYAGVVDVQVAVAELGRHGFHRPEIHHVDCARAHQLRNALTAGRFQAMRSRTHHPAYQLVCELRGGEVENG